MHKYIHYIFILKPDFVNFYVTSNNKKTKTKYKPWQHYSAAIGLNRNFYIYTYIQKKKHINTKICIQKTQNI